MTRSLDYLIMKVFVEHPATPGLVIMYMDLFGVMIAHFQSIGPLGRYFL